MAMLNAEQDAEREAKRKSILRLNLSINDGTSPIFWKHDGQRFAGKPTKGIREDDWLALCSEGTVKLRSGRNYQLSLTSNRPVQIRENSGRWNIKEVDANGREVEPRMGMLPPVLQPQSQPQLGGPSDSAAYTSSTSGGRDAGADGGAAGVLDPRALQWTDATKDPTRSTYQASLPCSLAPTPAGRRQYLLVEAFVQDFGLVVCPVQLKVYSLTDKGALQSFPLRYVQYDFREDSSGTGDLFAVNFY